MTEPSEGTSCPRVSTPVHPAAQVIDYTPIPRATRSADRHADWTPYQTLAYLAYVLPARIYAANPWLLDPKYRNTLENL